jgi:hypothetical protein
MGRIARGVVFILIILAFELFVSKFVICASFFSSAPADWLTTTVTLTPPQRQLADAADFPGRVAVCMTQF